MELHEYAPLNGLSIQRRKAILALLSTRTVQEAADTTGIPVRTLFSWLRQAAFKQAVQIAEEEILDAGVRLLVSTQVNAILTIENLMLSEEVAPAVRLRAAQLILDYLIKMRESRNVEKRLSILEGVIHELNSQKTS